MKKDTYADQELRAIERLKAMLKAQKAGTYVSPNKREKTTERDFGQISDVTVYASI